MTQCNLYTQRSSTCGFGSGQFHYYDFTDQSNIQTRLSVSSTGHEENHI